MKIAFTADVHLSPARPERIDNLGNVMKELNRNGVSTLVIAGDLLDSADDGYIEFDRLAAEHANMSIIIIPGNHDPVLRPGMFESPGIEVITAPVVREIGGAVFMFLPYNEGDTMGGAIEKSGLAGQLQRGRWFLVSHGDFGRINREQSGNEQGYFPLAVRDIQQYRPSRVILGHVHAPNAADEEVVYCGSPWPLDINETGQRRILLLDTGSGKLDGVPLTGTPLYARTRISLIPDGMEGEQIRAQIASAIEEEEKRYRGEGLQTSLVMRVHVSGYSTTRENIREIIEDTVKGYGASVEGVDLDSLKVSQNDDLARIAIMVRDRISSMGIRVPGEHAPYINEAELKQEVLKRAYEIIYGQGR